MIKIYANVARILLGLVLVVAVLFRLFASPTLTATMGFPPAAQNWLDIMKATGYLQTLLYTTEFIGGAALLMDIFIPLVLIALAPVILNIALFHIFLDARLARIALVLLMLGAHLLLVYIYRRSFAPLFHPVKPTWSGLKFRFLSVRLVFQVILGLAFALAGGAKLLIPNQLSLGDLLIDGMKNTGYLYSLLGFTELVTGIVILSGRFVPLALAISAPIALNIFLYHLFLAPAGLLIGFILVVIHIALLVAYANAYRSLVRPKVSIAE
jgi:putative oxidoreductase